MRYAAAPTLKLYFTPLHFILQSPDIGVSAQLILERNTGRCYCTENFNPFENGAKEDELFYLDIFSIVGVILVDAVLYLCVITDADVIGNINKANIYEIKGIELLPYVFGIWEPETHIFEKENITKLLTTGFYFSYYYDLTRSLQRSKTEGNMHSRADKSFYWNLELCSDLILQDIDSQWLIPLIQGYVGIEEIDYMDFQVTLALISRRSCDRTGTRYNCRGVDDEGNVANFVETEQIMIVNNKTFSYVQIRGSVPVYWEQTGITAQVAISRPQELSVFACKKHIMTLIQKYSHLTLINLLQDAKSHEKLLSSEFENVFKRIRQEYSSKVVYQYYDFHANCKGRQHQAVNDLIKGLQEYSNYYRFYAESVSKIEQRQKGVMRTNCLDCLDRTNVVQCYIAWAMIKLMWQYMEIELNSSLDSPINFPLIKAFKNIWADNGDLLSLQYTGTESTISSITRGEKQGLRSLISQSLKSLGRFYNANLNDAAKQKTIEAVLRRSKDTFQGNKSEFQQKVDDSPAQSSCSLLCVTWNMGGTKLAEDFNMKKLIIRNADIIVFSFQELVKLNAQNILREKSNSKRITNIKKLVSKVLSVSEYSLICENSLVGLLILVYVKLKICPEISQVQTDFIKLGLGGKTGNKGSVVGRFNLNETSFCFISCHLASGVSNNDLRKSQISDIQATIFSKEGQDINSMQIFEHDFKFIMGDLNFRIDLPFDTIRGNLFSSRLPELLEHDQLTKSLNEGDLAGYKEAYIEFPPTYKFEKSGSYNSSRCPAWCDRILFNGSALPLQYGYIELVVSDHKPVFCEFEITCKISSLTKRQQVRDNIFQDLT